MRLKYVPAIASIAFLLCSTRLSAQQDQLESPAKTMVSNLEGANANLTDWLERARTDSTALDVDALIRIKQLLDEMRLELAPLAEIHAKNSSAAMAMKAVSTKSKMQVSQVASREQLFAADAEAQALLTRAQAWETDFMAIGEGGEARRDAALNELHAVFEKNNPLFDLVAVCSLLLASQSTAKLSSFRPALLAIIEREQGDALENAFYALAACGKQTGDLERLHSAFDRDALNLAGRGSHLLGLFGGSQLTGRSAEIVLEGLNSNNPAVRRETLRGTWGAQVSEAVMARTITLAQTGSESRHDAIYFGLSTWPNKNRDVVDTLLKASTDSDSNIFGRALWGLSFGVPEAEHTHVVEGLVALHNARSNFQLRSECERIVRNYGGEEAEALLQR